MTRERELQALIEELTGVVRQEFGLVKERLARIEGRLDEQSATLNALIPQKIAAVGERKVS